MKRNDRRSLVACFAVAVIIAASGCGRGGHEVGGAAPAKAQDGQQAGSEGHGLPATPADAARNSLEERVSVKCEHDLPMYQCAECRYEVGVVKVDASLFKREDGGGLVRTQTVTRTKVSSTLSTTGEVALNENAAVHIRPPIAGVIESVKTDIGTRVKAGDILLTLGSVELGSALAEHERNRTLTELAERTFTREKRLWEQKVSSEQDMIDAQMVYEQHRTELKSSEETLHVLGLTEADLARLREPQHGTGWVSLPVRAPIAGTIIEKHVVAGETAEPGNDVMLLADLSTVWVWANVHAQDLAQLIGAEERGAVPVEISVTAFPDRRFKGMLTYVGATMSEETRMVKVRATVENTDMALRPGMFCEATIALGDGQVEEVLAVPRNAVLSDEGKDFVFKHWKDDFFVRQDVRKGREFFGAVELLEGLQEGETVVAEGAFLLKSDVLREKMGAGCAD